MDELPQPAPARAADEATDQRHTGKTRSETRLFYDERALSTYATVTGWTDPATTVRGNLTTTQRWLNYPAVSWVITKSDYDQCGSVRKATDANNKDTLTFYNDLFSDAVSRNTYAYPTEVDTPAPGCNGSSVPLKTYTTYDFQTGKVTKSKDPNNQETLYSYYPGNPVDPVGFPGRSLNRLQDVTRPDLGDHVRLRRRPGLGHSRQYQCPPEDEAG